MNPGDGLFLAPGFAVRRKKTDFPYFPPRHLPLQTSAVTAIRSPQCEDERFELDMVIDAASSAIGLLDLMAQDILKLGEEAGVRHMPIPGIYLCPERSTVGRDLDHEVVI